MTKYKVEIDFNKKTVSIEDKLIHTSIVQSDSGLARVHHPAEIPANSQMNVLVRISRRKSGDQVLLEPASSLNNRNLAGAKCLVTVNNQKAVMSIINPTNEPVYLSMNTVVATVCEVDRNELYSLADENEGADSQNTYCANINVADMERGNDINLDLSSSDLTNLQKKNLSKFLKQNQDIFSPTLQTLGRTDLYHHTIETEPGEGPVR